MDNIRNKRIIELVKSLDRLDLEDIIFYSKLWDGIKQIEKEELRKK